MAVLDEHFLEVERPRIRSGPQRLNSRNRLQNPSGRSGRSTGKLHTHKSIARPRFARAARRAADLPILCSPKRRILSDHLVHRVCQPLPPSAPEHNKIPSTASVAGRHEPHRVGSRGLMGPLSVAQSPRSEKPQQKSARPCPTPSGFAKAVDSTRGKSPVRSFSTVPPPPP